MMVTLARHVGRYEGLGLAGGMGHVQKDRDNNLGSGVSDAGYCLSARCADGFATARTTTPYEGDPTLNQPLADQSCANFKVRFLIPLASTSASRNLRE